MHILQGVLALLLLPGAAFAASPFDKMIGNWAGTVTSDDGCEWQVGSQVNGGGNFTGTFTYSGECANAKNTGKFKIKPSGKSCYAATVNIAGLPAMPVSGCADKAGNITFKTEGFSGKLTFTKGNKTFSLKVDAEKGSAAGQFRRVAPKRRAPAAQMKATEEARDRADEAISRDAGGKGRDPEDDEDSDAPREPQEGARHDDNSSEVLIGGY